MGEQTTLRRDERQTPAIHRSTARWHRQGAAWCRWHRAARARAGRSFIFGGRSATRTGDEDGSRRRAERDERPHARQTASRKSFTPRANKPQRNVKGIVPRSLDLIDLFDTRTHTASIPHAQAPTHKRRTRLLLLVVVTPQARQLVTEVLDCGACW